MGKELHGLQCPLFLRQENTLVKTHASNNMHVLVDSLGDSNVFRMFKLPCFSTSRRGTSQEKETHFGSPFFELGTPKLPKGPFRSQTWVPKRPIPSFGGEPKGPKPAGQLRPKDAIRSGD